jgi:hypothetical protein
MKLDWRSLAKSSQTCTSLRCTGMSGAQAGPAANSLLSGIGEGGEPTAPKPTANSPISGRHVARANGHLVALDYPMCGVPSGPRAQQSASLEKERDRALFMSGGAPDCPVHQPTEGKNCLPNEAPTTPRPLRTIKGTPMRLQQ